MPAIGLVPFCDSVGKGRGECNMLGIFSKRRSPPSGQYRYDFPENVRRRIIHTISQLRDDSFPSFDMEGMLKEVGQRLLREYGSLQQSSDVAASRNGDPVLEHYFCCDDELWLDFVELCFQTRYNCGRQNGVDAINDVFRDAGIGFELTPFVEIDTGKPGNFSGRPMGTVIEYRYPRIIRKDEQFTHERIIGPCLEMLSHPKLRTANAEMLKAHEDYRKSNYADAITSCASSFESVLKTVCDHHGWPYDSDKHTCSKLVDICREHELFPPFYESIFKATGTIRNKLGDAHGRGPTPNHAVKKEHVDHMLQITSANIILVVGLAAL